MIFDIKEIKKEVDECKEIIQFKKNHDEKVLEEFESMIIGQIILKNFKFMKEEYQKIQNLDVIMKLVSLKDENFMEFITNSEEYERAELEMVLGSIRGFDMKKYKALLDKYKN